MSEIRVRFAPSPTGPLHIGGVRTALYNYLFAKKHGGKMILRIEDTDQGRFVTGAEDYIIESLEWCGIKFDEGVHIGGAFAPYRQSDRKAMYQQYALQLIENGTAYYAFDTPEELDALRKEYEAKKETFQYGPKTRKGLKNSITLSKEETQQLLENGNHYVIRFKIPENETVTVNDIIRGEVKVDSSLLDDKVLYKSDGMPTYHLANIVDDYLMKISHVIRGEEWLPSAPLHVLLYKSFGWADKMPQFAHLPLLLKPDGNGKLSKRDGDRLGFPVFPLQWKDPKTNEISSGYRESGYLPEAVVNMLAFLGWNPGTEQELFTMDELIQSFSLERVSKSGAKFDLEKAHWFNHQFLHRKTNEELSVYLEKMLVDNHIVFNKSMLPAICELIKDRVTLLPDLLSQSKFFFVAPETYDEKVIQKVWKTETPTLLSEVLPFIENTNPFTAETFEKNIREFCTNKNIGMGMVMNPIRLAIVGTNAGPSMTHVAEILGKEEMIKRIKKGVEKIK